MTETQAVVVVFVMGVVVGAAGLEWIRWFRGSQDHRAALDAVRRRLAGIVAASWPDPWRPESIAVAGRRPSWRPEDRHRGVVPVRLAAPADTDRA